MPAPNGGTHMTHDQNLPENNKLTVSNNLFKVSLKLERPAAGGTHAGCQAWKVLGLCHVDESLHLTRWKPYEVESAITTTKPRQVRQQ